MNTTDQNGERIVQLFANYERHLDSQNLTRATKKAYLKRVGVYVKYCLLLGDRGTMDNSHSDTTHSRDFQKYLLEELQLRNNTINGYSTALDRFWDFAGIRPDRKSFDTLKRENKVPKTLSDDEILRFLKALRDCDSSKTRAIAMLLFTTGMSASECVNLDIADVNLDEYSPCILKRSARKKRIRTVPIDALTRAALGDWLDSRGIPILEALEKPLFVNDRNSQRLTVSGVDSIIRNFGARSYLEVSPRILRDTYLRMHHGHRNIPTKPITFDPGFVETPVPMPTPLLWLQEPRKTV